MGNIGQAPSVGSKPKISTGPKKPVISSKPNIGLVKKNTFAKPAFAMGAKSKPSMLSSKKKDDADAMIESELAEIQAQ